jgi:YtfJ family uncharacterized protein
MDDNMMKKTLALAILAIGSAFPALALNFSIGDTPPMVAVKQAGELTLKQDEIAYQPWQSKQMIGKTRVIQAIAGRTKAKALNKPLMDALVAAQFAENKYQTTTIVNKSDAVWGTGSFVKSSAEDSKREFYYSSVVLDDEGAVAEAWGLQPKSALIAVQDKSGKILWAKEGALTAAEISTVLTLIKDNL